MKKWISAIIILIIVLVFGGYGFAKNNQTQKNYNSAIRDGQTKIVKSDYAGAKSDFKRALDYKSKDANAKNLYNQTKAFEVAQDVYTKGHLDMAKIDFQNVTEINASNELKNRANDRIQYIDSLLNEMKSIVGNYNQALEQNQSQDFEASNQTIDQILSDSNIQDAYFRNILSNVIALRRNNVRSEASDREQTTVDEMTPSSKNNQNADKNASSNNSSSSTSESSSSNNDSNTSSSASSNSSSYPGRNEFTVDKSQTELNGKPISDKQIADARKEVNQAGLDSGAMSDQDIRNILQQANKDNLSVNQYIQKNY